MICVLNRPGRIAEILGFKLPCICKNIIELIEQLAIPHDRDHWIIFIDGSEKETCGMWNLSNMKNARMQLNGLCRFKRSCYNAKCCVLCLWDNKGTKNHHTVEDWSNRPDFVRGEFNIKCKLLIPRKNLPPLHINLVSWKIWSGMRI